MTSLLTRMTRRRCASCQVGQGRGCFCEEARRELRPKRRKLSPTEWLWIILTASVATSIGSGLLIVGMVQSWRAS